jgi:hypothetical protein
MRDRRTLDFIAGRVNSDGTIAAGEGFQITGSGGAYFFIAPKGFRLVSLTGNGPCIVMPDTYSERSCRVVTVQTVGGAAVAAPWNFIAAGYKL